MKELKKKLLNLYMMKENVSIKLYNNFIAEVNEDEEGIELEINWKALNYK